MKVKLEELIKLEWIPLQQEMEKILASGSKRFNADDVEHLAGLVSQLKKHPTSASSSAQRIAEVFDMMTDAEFAAWYKNGGLYS
ncbi:MAG TPA: hypothetical protein DCP69_07175 [Candidatus Omnitrophica bacterium]|nr:hypothetical protein [Candidatus Omnitrophota bacterium]